MERTKRSTFNIIYGFINKIITVLMPFILRTVLIKVLSESYLGLSSLFTSILQVLSLAELGLGSTVIFAMYKPVEENDIPTICAYLYFYRRFFHIIGLIMLAIGLAIMPFIGFFIKGTYPADINLYILYAIYLFNTVIGYFCVAYKCAIFSAYQRNDIISNISTIITFIQYVIQIIVLILFKNYYAYIIFMPLATLANNMMCGVIAKRKYPNLVCYGELTQNQKSILFSKVKGMIGHKIGGVVVNSLDTIVVSAFLGLTTTAIYGNYYYIIAALNGFVNVVYVAILASVGSFIVTAKSKDEIYGLFKKVHFLFLWIVGLFTVCLFCLYQHFMYIWVGEKLMFSFGIMLVFCIYFYTWQFRMAGLLFKDAAGMWIEDFWKPYIGIIVNLVTNIILVQFIGVYGVLISTIIVMIVIYFPWETHVLFSKLFNRSSGEYIGYTIYFIVVTMITMCVTYLLCKLLPIYGIYWFIIKVALCLVCCNLIFLIIFHKTKEFKNLQKRVLTLLHKMG